MDISPSERAMLPFEKQVELLFQELKYARNFIEEEEEEVKKVDEHKAKATEEEARKKVLAIKGSLVVF